MLTKPSMLLNRVGETEYIIADNHPLQHGYDTNMGLMKAWMGIPAGRGAKNGGRQGEGVG